MNKFIQNLRRDFDLKGLGLYFLGLNVIPLILYVAFLVKKEF